MKSKAKRIVKSAIQAYKPIDKKLRPYRLYTRATSKLRNAYQLRVDTRAPDCRSFVEGYSSATLNPGTVFLESFFGEKISCNPYAVYQALQASADGSNLQFIWVIQNATHIPNDLVNKLNVRFVKRGSAEYGEALLTSETIISNMTLPRYFAIRPGQKYFNVWHGVPLKCMGLDASDRLNSVANVQRNFHSATHLPLAGGYAIEKIVASNGARLAARDKALPIGSPRVDITLKAKPNEVRAKLSITNDKPIVLYAPTWRGNAATLKVEVTDQLKVVEQLSAALEDDYNLIVSIHHFASKKIEAANLKCSLVPDDMNINEVLSAVDVLIGDYSSIIVDFLPLDRPVIAYTPDIESYIDSRGLYLRPEQLPVTVAHDIPQLLNALRSPRKPSTFDQYAIIKQSLIPHEDGMAAQRVAVQILTKPASRPTDEKRRILIYPGGLKTNGITSAFLSLIANIDFEETDVSVLVDAHTTDSDEERYDNFRKIDPRCEIILRPAKFYPDREENRAYRRFLNDPENASIEDQQRIIQSFSREARRLVGNSEFTAAIDFSGYSPFWTLIIAASNAQTHITYQHSDMLAEAENNEKNHVHLPAVFTIYRLFDRVISVSRELHEVNKISLRKYYTSDDSTRYAPNPISPSKINELSQVPVSLAAPSARHMEDLNGVTKFVCVGRLSPEKGQARLLRAFAKLLASGENAVLLLVGSGPSERALKSLARRIGIRDRVIFVGRLSNPFPVIKLSDCLVLPSDYEGQGLALLEAMTLGIPCIGSDIPSVRGILGDGYAGLSERTADDLANKMILFCRDGIAPPRFDPQSYNDVAMQAFYTHAMSQCVRSETNDITD